MEQPARIGRFVVLRKLGEGGMGVVYAAYDEELDRKLAIKLVLPGLPGARQSLGETRLLREAQALARVSHPNVVQVYEVGSVGDAVFIAMELVRGKTIGEWLAARPRHWREIVGVFMQAGAGLAAAHAAGVVHRDVKPDNLLVGDDGRVRVLDFSLASPTVEPGAGDDLPIELHRTRAGSLIGTPLYMSPEQLLGKPADARSDQFSLCVALFEALFRVRPFAGATLDELRQSVTRGEIHGSRAGLLRSFRPGDSRSRVGASGVRSVHRSAVAPGIRDSAVAPIPRDSAAFAVPKNMSGESAHDAPAEPAPLAPRPGAPAPAWLRRALLRGLRIEPEARYPDMNALLAELGRDPSRAWRRAAAAAAALALVAVGVGAAIYVAESRRAVCSGAAARLVGVWDPERRAAAERAVLATQLPFAATTWASVAATLDERAAAWTERRNDACADSQLRGEQSLALLERRNACLDARLRELDALARVLTEARPETVERAVQAAANLRPLGPCDDEAALLARVPAPDDPELAVAVDALRGRLARVEALELSGDLKAALAEAEAAQTDAAGLAYPPLHAEAALARGRAALGLTRLAEAAEQLEAAYHAANRIRHDEVLTMAAIKLVSASRELARLDAADAWARLAEDALIRGGRPPGPTATWLQARSQIAADRGRPAEALALAEEALSLRQGAMGQDHPDMVQSYNSLGLALHAIGRDADALAAYDAGLELAERVLGLGHPGAVPLLNNRASVLSSQGKLDEALASYRRGLEIRARVYGRSHPRYAFSLAQIGDALTSQGKYTEAAAHLQEALEIRTRALGADHPEVGETLIGIGKVEFRRGNKEAAIKATQRALVVLSSALGPDSPRVASVKSNLAVMYRDQGQLALALATNAEVRANLEKTLPPGHARLLAVRGNQANVLRDLERYDEALSEYAQLLALQEAAAVPPVELAHTLMGLGQTHLARGAAADAVAPLERALTLLTGAEDLEFTREQIELALARALWPSRPDRPRARQLAESAATRLRAAGPDAAEHLREVEAWLKSPGQPAP